MLAFRRVTLSLRRSVLTASQCSPNEFMLPDGSMRPLLGKCACQMLAHASHIAPKVLQIKGQAVKHDCIGTVLMRKASRCSQICRLLD